MQMDTEANVPLAGKQAGFHGIGACNVEKGGTHENSDGNASIFRAVSRVRAFYRDLDTLPDTEGVFSILFVRFSIRILNPFDQNTVCINGKGLKMKNRVDRCTVNWSADTLSVLDRGEIHLVSEFIRAMYNSAAGALTGTASPSNSTDTWLLWNTEEKNWWLPAWAGIYFEGMERQKCNHAITLPHDSPQAAGVGCMWATTHTNKSYTRQQWSPISWCSFPTAGLCSLLVTKEEKHPCGVYYLLKVFFLFSSCSSFLEEAQN